MASYPEFKTLLSAPDPTDVLRVKRSFFSILSLCAKVIASIILIVLINIIFGGELRLSYFTPVLPDISLRWLGIIPAVLFLNTIREYHDDIYIFGLHGITQHQGRLSLTKRVPHVKYSDILSLKVRQDPWGRVFNYGDLDLDTAAESGVEIVVQGVDDPNELCRLIETLRLYSIKHGMVQSQL